MIGEENISGLLFFAISVLIVNLKQQEIHCDPQPFTVHTRTDTHTQNTHSTSHVLLPHQLFTFSLVTGYTQLNYNDTLWWRLSIWAPRGCKTALTWHQLYTEEPTFTFFCVSVLSPATGLDQSNPASPCVCLYACVSVCVRERETER